MRFFIVFSLLFVFCFRPHYNAPLEEEIPHVDDYHFYAEDSTLFFVCFSGGGTRAACMSWESLKYLSNFSYSYNWATGESLTTNLSESIDYLSGISGGSFAATAWMLYRDSMEVFDKKFIEADIQRDLLLNLLATPQAWLSPYYNRIDVAAEYYNDKIFNNWTFADLPPSPKLWIAGTHLALGVRFLYTWDYFSLLNSDLSKYWLGYACAASSAFPVLLDPITLINYSSHLSDSALCSDLEYKIACLNSSTDTKAFYYKRTRDFFNSPKNKFNHIADGGIVDNRGLQVILDQFEVGGDINRCFNKRQLKRLIFLNVSAWTDIPDKSCEVESSPNELSVIKYSASTPINILSDVFWERIKDKANSLWQASEDLGLGMERPYFIEVSFKDVVNDSLRNACYSIPTSFNLQDSEIDLIRKVVPDLISSNPDFKRLIRAF